MKIACLSLVGALSSLTLVAPAPAQTLSFVEGSSVKLEQLLGEVDKERQQPTLSLTFTRYKIRGTDLGQSIEHQGRAYFFFGDTVGALGGALDTIATTDATDPEHGVRLDFLTAPGKPFLTIQPPGLTMAGFETPDGVLSLDGHLYVSVRTNHAKDWSTDRSVLTKFSPPTTFTPLRTLSQSPAGRFLTMSMHVQPGPIAGLPAGGPYVLIWGTAQYRRSDPYLQIVPQATFETGKGTLYFSGLDAGGRPTWSPSESAAKPLFNNGTMGDISVTWCKDFSLWLMTFDSRPPAKRGVLFTYSPTPWGPWPDRQVIFSGATAAGGTVSFIHDPSRVPDDRLAGPVIGEGSSNPNAVHGGTYAPYVVERWTKVRGAELLLYYTLSTWNPYVVVLMKSQFRIQEQR
jgi:hypothetical protein